MSDFVEIQKVIYLDLVLIKLQYFKFADNR